MDNTLLWQPLEIKGHRLANRCVAPPMMTSSGAANGAPTERSLQFYRHFIESGAGLVILEHHAVRDDGFLHPTQLGLQNDTLLAAHRPLRAIFAEAGVPALVQLNHCGSASEMRPNTADTPPPAPSAIRHPQGYPTLPREMSLEECRAMAQAYVDAAARAVSLGYEGVEIHSCHGYLLGQFLSPLTNRRTDCYGGDIAGRSRLLREISATVRNRFPDIILAVRLGVVDAPTPQPLPEELVEPVWVARELKALGVDLIDVTGNMCGHAVPWPVPWRPWAAAIQKEVGNLPVINTCNIRTPETAEELLQERVCSLIGVGRPLLRSGRYFETWRV